MGPIKFSSIPIILIKNTFNESQIIAHMSLFDENFMLFHCRIEHGVCVLFIPIQAK